jgi:hypothetical protein
MAGFSGFEVIKAIDAVVSADATLLAMLGAGTNAGIVSNPQESEPAFPYIVIGDYSASAWDTKDKNGAEVLATIHAWSQSGDPEQCSNILSRLHFLLHNAQLSVASNDFLLILWDGLTDIIKDNSDGLFTYHGVIRFKCITREQ